MVKFHLFFVAFCMLVMSIQADAQSSPRRYLDYLGLATVRTYDIAYGQSVNDQGQLQTQRLDIYQLRDDPVAVKPAIVIIHGGNFTGGDKAHVAIYANEYVKRGYLAILVNYRVSSKKFKNELSDPNFVAAADDAKEDVLGAIRWLRANATQWGIDKGRIGVMGFSSGATIAFAVNSDQEFQSQENDADHTQSTAISTIVELVGLTDPTIISPTDKPVLMVHGETDSGIKKENVLNIYQALQSNNIPVKLRYAPGGHDMEPYIKEIGIMTSRWFKSFLVDAKPAY